MDKMNASKEMCYALRHAPFEYELDMDEDGYVPIQQLLEGLNHSLTYDELCEIVKSDSKGRYDIKGDKICALYGHSFDRKIVKQAACPPDVLYHGTSRQVVDLILKEGLKSMKRQYVHLSVDVKTAMQVGGRHDCHPVLLVIDAKRAYHAGVKFYQGSAKIWLCDFLEGQYIRKESEEDGI